MADVDKLPNCPVSGKLSLPTKRLPPDLRVWRNRGEKHGYCTTYKCRHCPYWHQTKG